MASAGAGATWSKGVESYKAFAKITVDYAEAAVGQMFSHARAQGSPLAALGRTAATPLRVLDIAAGTGASTFALVEAACAANPQRHVHITATDIAEGMLAELQAEFAQRRYVDLYPNVKLNVSVADMQALPFDAASHDVVLMIFGLMFPPNPVAALQEARRVLSPGGYGVVLTWHNTSPADMVREIAVSQGRAASEEEVVFPMEVFGIEANVARLLRRSGWHVAAPCDQARPVRAGTANDAAISFLQCPPAAIAIDALVGRMEVSPVYSKYGPYDLDAAAGLLRAKYAEPGTDSVRVTATALMVLARAAAAVAP